MKLDVTGEGHAHNETAYRRKTGVSKIGIRVAAGVSETGVRVGGRGSGVVATAVGPDQ